MPNKKSHLYSLAMLPGIVRGLDLLSIVVGAVLAHAVYFQMILERDSQLGHYIVVVLAALLLWMNITHDRGLYDVTALNNFRSHLRQALFSWVLVILGVIALGFLLKVSSLYSRGWMILWFFVTTGLFGGIRLALFHVFHRWHGFGRFALRTAIYGGPEDVRRLARLLHKEGRQGFVHVVGLFSTISGNENEKLDGDLTDLFAMARQGQLDSVILAMPWREEHVIHDLAQQLRNVVVDVRLAPEQPFFELPWREFVQIGDIPMLKVHDRALKEWNALFKRCEDILLSSFLLVLLSPIMLLTAALVRLESPGPVLFRQKRFGFNNQPVDVMKFRTMYVEKGDASGEVRTVRGDPRVTRLGRILRKYSLDELPQLINVFKGEMSLVGPRAHPEAMKVGEDYYHHVFAEYASRHRVRPGITGLAQVSGCRGEVNNIEKARQRLEYDLWYVDHWSIGLDLRIILRTIWQVMCPRDVY